MKYLSEFVIPFVGLKLGKHHYGFDIDHRFFEEIDYSEIDQSDVKVEVTMEKTSRMLIFDFHIFGTVEVTCDRCAGDYNQVINGNQRLYVKFGEETEEQAENIIVLAHKEHEIDIAHLIYEYINLFLPVKLVHPKGECDEQVIEKLGELSNRRKEGEIDPRWEALKKLKT